MCGTIIRMARPLRIELPGGLYHVMSRGNERQPIVRDDADRCKRVDWLRRTVETYGWRLHAFALMTNHEHLFVETPEANLSAGMKLLNGSYTGYFNHRHKRAGHLFQGRFKAQLVEQQDYFLEISRYIHLNPVRAKLAGRPDAWPWGSCPGYLRATRRLDWICYDRVLGEFGRTTTQARRAYGQFLRAGIDEPPRSPFETAVAGLIVGSSSFVDKVRGMLDGRPADANVPQLARIRRRPELAEIIAVVADHFEVDPSQWSSGRRDNGAARAVAAYLARRRFGYPAVEVAAALGYRDHSGVGRAIRRIEQATAKLNRDVKKLEKKLSP